MMGNTRASEPHTENAIAKVGRPLHFATLGNPGGAAPDFADEEAFGSGVERWLTGRSFKFDESQ